ncbi:MAG: c-type cytochrome [Planctomycetaceae bacterium]
MYWYAIEPLVPANPERAIQLAAESKIPLVTQFIYRRAAADEAALPKLLAAIGTAPNDQVRQLMLGEVMNVVRTSGRLEMPTGWPEVYAQLARSENAEVRQQAQFITVKFGDKSIFPALREIAADTSVDAAARTSALEALASGKDADLPPVLLSLLDDSALQRLAIRTLAAYDVPQAQEALVSRYAAFDEAGRADAIATLVSRTPTALALLDAIEAKRIPRTDLKAFHVTQMQQHGSEELLARLNDVWGTIRSTPAEKQAQIAEYKKLLTAESIAEADLPHGRELYVRNCGKCHKLFGAGESIGPDITGSNRANLDYILQNVLDPSALVGRDYQTTMVVTSDGRVLTGLIKEENETGLVLQTATEVVVIDKADVDTRKLSEQSLMPEGQLKEMSAEDVRDLIAYLGTARQVPLPGAGPVYDDESKRVQGALEGETLRVVKVTGGAAAPQPMGGFSADRWSGVNQLWWTGGNPGTRLTLAVPVKEPGRYELFAVMTKARDYGIVQLALDGEPLGGPIDLYNNPEVITTGPLSLGTVDLTAGEHQLTIEITGTNPQAVKVYMFGLDYLYLGRLPAVTSN